MTRPFSGDRRGAVLVVLSLILPVILMGVLGLMGISGFANARSDLKAASDAAANAVLADLNGALQVSATPDALVTSLDKQARAESVVASLLGTRSDLSNIRTRVETTDTTVSVTVSAQVRNTTGDLFWAPFATSSATTTVSWVKADQLQIALAIDSGTSVSTAPSVQIRMSLLKLELVSAVGVLSVLPNIPDIALSVVPFTAQVAADPSIVMAANSEAESSFRDALNAHFAEAGDWLLNWIAAPAHAGVTACFNDPIVPKGIDGSAFGGTSKPLQNSCETSLQPIRSLARISKPRVNGQIVLTEAANSPEKLARDAITKTINAISPAGCRNLAMGVTWSLAQLPNDLNPKIIFLVANGQNSKSARGRTPECSGGSAGSKSVIAELDKDFVAACALVRDPTRNKGRMIDLLVVQAVDGNPAALKSCASTVDGVANYFSTSTSAAFTAVFESARKRLVQVAQRQQKIRADQFRGRDDD